MKNKRLLFNFPSRESSPSSPYPVKSDSDEEFDEYYNKPLTSSRKLFEQEFLKMEKVPECQDENGSKNEKFMT